MLVHAVVPVKSLRQSKTRLSIVFTPKERTTLILAMLNDVLNALKSSLICKVCLVASDNAVQNLADDCKVTYHQERHHKLNPAVELGVKWCIEHQAEAVLIVPADIPMITAEDINGIIRLATEPKCIVVSPSMNGGTNALLQKPPGVIPVRFGSNSYMKHINQASCNGISVKSYWSKRVAADVDTLDDLDVFFEAGRQTLFHQFMQQVRLRKKLVAGH